MEQNIGIIRLRGVIELTGLARSTIYAKLNPNDPSHAPTFPAQIRLGRCAVGWLVSEIENWLASRPRVRFPVPEVAQ